jgi:hypothetical protein
MKKPFFVLTAVLVSILNVSFAQSTNFDEVKLEKAADYKVAEPFALEASNYLHSTPFDKNDVTRLKALQFIIKWMSGTPDYMFTLDGTPSKMSKGNSDVLGLYMAALTKYVLENKEAAKNAQLVKLNAVTLVLAYCENTANNMKMTKELKRLSAAKAKGELEKNIL